VIVVQDILPAIQRATGQNNQNVLFEYLNRAIQTLSKITPADTTLPVWDPALIYVDLPVQNPPGNIVILPYEIDRPVKVNVNSEPSFSRTRLFEFTLNAPGSSLVESGWQWQDRGIVPIQQFIQTPSRIIIASSAGAADAGVQISAVVTAVDGTGLSSSGFNEFSVVWTLGASGTFTTASTIGDVREVYISQSPAPTGVITLTLQTGSTLIASYPVGMTKPEYAVIKISQPGYSVRILAKRKNWKVSLPTDWIPLSDQMAVIVATQFIKFLEEIDYDHATPALGMATQLLQNDQAIKMSFAAVAAASEIQTPLNLNIIARDVLQVNDIYDEWCTIAGQVGQQKVFDSMTEAIETLANKSEWDPLIGYVDLLVSNNFDTYVTLPREVETPLAINVNGRPGVFLSKWFEFNCDGMGEAEFYPQGSLTPLPNQAKRDDRQWEDVGEVVVAFDPINPGPLLAWPFSPSDAGAQITVYGADINMNPLVQTLSASQNYASAIGGPAFYHIWRITKPVTQGFIGLLQTDGTQNIQTLGTYWPTDIEPRYKRIKLQLGPQQLQPKRIRMRYRKRWMKISSLTDIIPLKNRSALTMIGRYLVQIKTGQDVQMFSENMLQQAIDLANADWRRANPREVLQIQVDRSTFGCNYPLVF
jgi:hypothetical protein